MKQLETIDSVVKQGNEYWLNHKGNADLLPCTIDDMIMLFERDDNLLFVAIREDLTKCTAAIYSDSLELLKQSTKIDKYRKHWNQCTNGEKYAILHGAINMI